MSTTHQTAWHAWTVPERTLIATHYATAARPDLLALLPGRTWRAIQLQASKLGVDRNGTWQPGEDAHLRTHYAATARPDLLALLPGRSWGALQERATKLGLCRTNHWLPEHQAILHEHYALRGAAYVAALVGRRVDGVMKQARKLGLRRTWGLRPARRAGTGPTKAPKPTAPRKTTKRQVRPPVVQPDSKRNTAAGPPKKPDAAPLLAVKRSAGTPNLNLQKEARRKAEEAPKKAVSITAEAIRKLPANHPARHAYAMGGVAGWQQWKQQQPTS